MQYQALYRKYRPKSFDEVVGQNVIKQTLLNAIKTDKISHAYIFSGPRGTGKTTMAKIFARAVNCTNSKDGNPCGKCDCCSYSFQKECPDIIELDAASNNKVDDIRSLIENVDQVPNYLKYKVYIIDEVHMLSNSAFNALLKTIEEPPSNIIFILATTEINKVPITILSRCQNFSFNRINDNDMKSKLHDICNNEKIEIDDEVIGKICLYSDGCMRDAISLLDKISSYKTGKIVLDDMILINGTIDDNSIDDFINYILENDFQKIIEKINVYYNQGKNIQVLSQDIIKKLESMYIDWIERKNSNTFDSQKICNLIDTLNETIFKLKESSNPKLTFEVAILNFMYENNKESVEIISREIISNKVDEKKAIENQKTEKINTEIISREIISDKNDEKNEKNDNKNEKNNNESQKIISREIIFDENNLEKIKKIRINNSFASANKNLKTKVETEWNKISNEIFSTDHGFIASALYDSKVEVVGNKNMIISCKVKSYMDIINSNLPTCSKILNNIFDNTYDIIALDISEWDKVRNDYIANLKSKKYEYIEEPSDLVNHLLVESSNESTNDDILIQMFGEDVVKYE